VADKNFVVKNGLVVGDTLTLSGIELDLLGATSGQVLKFNGTKFAPNAEISLDGTVYITTIGNTLDSTITVNHSLGTRNVFVTVRNSSSPYEVLNVRWEATNLNSITLDFSTPPEQDSITVIVYAAVTGTQIISYKETIGDGSSNTFIISHNLNTRDIIVSVRNASSPYENIDCRWEATSVNSTTIYFSNPPSNSSVRVGILSV